MSYHIKNKRLLLLVLIPVLFICSVGLPLVCCSTSSNSTDPEELEKPAAYKGLEERWNEYTATLPASFRLYGDRGGSDENILAALNNWLKAFAIPVNSEYANELEKMKNKYGKTTFHSWDDFRKAHHRQNVLELSREMSPVELAETINNYIGVSDPQNPQDYISQDTVRTIVYMNSLCAFFEGEKAVLHKRGIDGKLHECRELTSKGEYPILDALLH